MAKYIDWYLVEMDGLLRNRIRSDRLHSLLTESEAHLTDLRDELEAQGMTREDAELAAIERFGRVRKVAMQAERGCRAPAKVLTAGVLLFWWLGLAAGVASLFAVPMVPGHALQAFGLFGPFLFAVSWASKRWHWRSLGLSAVVAMPLVAFTCGVAFQPILIPRRDAPKYVAQAEQSEASYSSSLREFRALRHANIPDPARKRSVHSIFDAWGRVLLTVPNPEKWTVPVSYEYRTPYTRLTAHPVQYGITTDARYALRLWREHEWIEENLVSLIDSNHRAAEQMKSNLGVSVTASAMGHVQVALVLVAFWFALGLAVNGCAMLVAHLVPQRSWLKRKYA